MNCLLVLIKPEINFNDINDVKIFLKSALPNYNIKLDEEDYIDIAPAINICEPFFQLDSEDKIFLEIDFFIRSSWIYNSDVRYLEIKNIIAQIATALKTKEWWYTSEMQAAYYEDYTPKEVLEFLLDKTHTLEFKESKNLDGINGEVIWFEHDYL